MFWILIGYNIVENIEVDSLNRVAQNNNHIPTSTFRIAVQTVVHTVGGLVLTSTVLS